VDKRRPNDRVGTGRAISATSMTSRTRASRIDHAESQRDPAANRTEVTLP
jgi:hypothetical protein